MDEPLVDSRIVFSATDCGWWDSIEKASTLPTGIPCCPFCRSVLMECKEQDWWDGARQYEKNGHPGYVADLKAKRGICKRKRVRYG